MATASRLYELLPTGLQHLAVAAYGVRMRYRRQRRVYQETRRALARSERLDSGELAELQAGELRRTVLHAARTIEKKMLADESLRRSVTNITQKLGRRESLANGEYKSC